MKKIYDSRDVRCKSPYGAVPCGTAVQITLRPDRSEGFSRGWLRARFEQENDRTVTLSLPWSGMEGGEDIFSAQLTVGDQPGLVWYTLGLEGFGGRRWVSPEYQLTVYDDREEIPGWFGEGVCYQIFPDRFHRTCVPDPAGMVGDRSVHPSWQERPEWRPDAMGQVRNRDYFGGNIQGVIEKLDDLSQLGVETLYLCPIFEAAENHRYGTADYQKIDPMLGEESDFCRLCKEAHARGMRVLLDGVFSHTGAVSRYFNRDGFYPEVGAYQSKESPYRSWFRFHADGEGYDSWWGIQTLPTLNKDDPGYRAFLFGEDGVVRRWLRLGADGWRLDVADELPDDFVAELHRAVRAEKPDGIVIGEVWEDGTTKIAYGVRRKHLLGGYLDGLMNYPFRSGLIAYLLGGDAGAFREEIETLRENYPSFAFFSAMNALGTHDTLRILTLLGVGDERRGESKEWRSEYLMSPEERARGIARLRLGAVVLFSFPGAPTIYYGDEAGMEGFEDPFNRQTYPWGFEDISLLEWFRKLGGLRKQTAGLRRGSLSWLMAQDGCLCFWREVPGQRILTAVNARENAVRLPVEGQFHELLTGQFLTAEENELVLPGMTAMLLEKIEE